MGKNWHEGVFFGLHYDWHARETDTGLGAAVTAEHLVKLLGQVKPDFIQCDCKGHPGYAAYPTAAGTPAPGLAQDMVAVWREAARRLGIPLGMHFSGIWDAAALKTHPEWGRVNSPKLLKYGFAEHHMEEDGRDRNMICPLSDYTDRCMIPQMLELIDRYDVDGFWVDGENWACLPCYCERCTEAFRTLSGITVPPEDPSEEGWAEWLQFSRDNFEAHVRRYTEAVHRRKPGCTVCSNWMYSVREPDPAAVPVDYLSGDFEWSWSASKAVLETRYLSGRGLSWELMAWGYTGYKTGSERAFKSVSALCQEAAAVISCGGAFMVYDKPHRDGTLASWHLEELAETARFCRARQALCQNADAVPQTAVLHARERYYRQNHPLFNPGEAMQPVEGALHALLENGFHADVIPSFDGGEELNRYALCISSEQEGIPETLTARMKAYVYGGGQLIVAGAEHTRAFDDILGVRDTGQTGGMSAGMHLPAGRRTVNAMSEWRLVELDGAECAVPLLLNREPGENQAGSGYPAVTVNCYGAGKIAGVYGPLFSGFAKSHFPQIRDVCKTIFECLSLEGLVRADAPPFVHLVLRVKGKDTLLHLVNLSADYPLSPQSPCVENVPFAGPVAIRIPKAAPPAAVSLAPSGDPVKWTFDNGVLTVTVPKIHIHEIVTVTGR